MSEFDKIFPCIDPTCDNGGTAVGGSPEEPEPLQCEYCYRERLPLKDWLRKTLTERDTALIEAGVAIAKGEKWVKNPNKSLTPENENYINKHNIATDRIITALQELNSK